MVKKTAYILMLTLWLALIHPVQAKLFNGEEFFLKNGMRVIVIPNHKAPIIKHMVWYRSGSVDELPGKGGTAHLLEHLMFRGSNKITGTQFNELLERNGAESNAFTGQDMTAYHQEMDISRLELAMFLEADRMQNLAVKETDFELERKIVYEERLQRIDNNPAAYFAEALRRTLWQDHPYARPVSGTAEEILALEKNDVEDFYRRFYAPNNAVLILSGDIDVPTARQLAEKYYGKLPKHPQIERIKFPRLENSFQGQLKMSRPNIQGRRVVRVYAAPSYNVAPEEIYNLSVLSAYLGEGETSKLYKKLVRRDKKALAVSTSYDSAARSYGTFSVEAVPAADVSSEELLAALDSAWAEALDELSVDEAEKTKQRMLAGLVYLRDNPNDAAYIAGAMAVSGMSWNEIEAQEDELRSVDYRGMKQAAEKLRQSPQLTGILEPEKGGAR